MPSQGVSLILEPSDFRILEGLKLNPRRSFSGRIRGERLTQRKGISIEFADFRDYVDGDDLRHLDWNALARLDAAVLRTYQDEEDLAMHLLLDGSASMSFGNPSKLEQARTLAAALGYVALVGQDAVYPYALGDRERPAGVLRGRPGYYRMASWLADRQPLSSRGLAASLREFASAGKRAGIALILSDGLDPDIVQSVRILSGRGHEVWFVQILSPEELDPDLEGDLRLLDSETGAPVEITASAKVLNQYRRNLRAHCAALEGACLQAGGRYALVSAQDPLAALLKAPLKREGWLI